MAVGPIHQHQIGALTHGDLTAIRQAHGPCRTSRDQPPQRQAIRAFLGVQTRHRRQHRGVKVIRRQRIAQPRLNHIARPERSDMTAPARRIRGAKDDRIARGPRRFGGRQNHGEFGHARTDVAKPIACLRRGVIVAKHRSTGGAAHLGHFGDHRRHVAAPVPDLCQEGDIVLIRQARALSLFRGARLHPFIIQRGDREIRAQLKPAILNGHVIGAHGHRGVIVERDGRQERSLQGLGDGIHRLKRKGFPAQLNAVFNQQARL